jgi:hypothetical protein
MITPVESLQKKVAAQSAPIESFPIYRMFTFEKEIAY